MTTGVQDVIKAEHSTAPTQSKSARQLAIEAIMDETGCNKAQANETMLFVESLVAKARKCNYGTVFPTAKQLASDVYDVFHQVIPHGMTSTPGSAHALVEDAVLDRTKDELGLDHDMRPGASRMFCGVQVRINAPLN